VRTAAIIVAAGRGERLGGPVPKQYRRIGGEAMLARSLRAALAAPGIDAVLAAIDPEAEALCAEAVAPLPLEEGAPVTAVPRQPERGDPSFTESRPGIEERFEEISLHRGDRQLLSLVVQYAHRPYGVPVTPRLSLWCRSRVTEESLHSLAIGPVGFDRGRQRGNEWWAFGTATGMAGRQFF
jgi:hypothetical protein